MAHRLSFVSTSRTGTLPRLINLGDTTNYFVSQYAPGTPKRREDGTYEPVTEAIDVMFVGATTTEARENVNRVETFLHDARDRVLSEAGVRYYFNLHIDGDVSGNRSELIDGRLELGQNTLRSFGQAKLEGRIIITRQPYWEGARSEIRLSGKVQPPYSKGGRIFYSHNDSTYGNYVDIASDGVTGSLPAPLEIEIQNASGANRGYRNWYIANNVWNSPTDFTHVLEGENRRSGYGTVVNFPSSTSNNQYVALTVNTTTTIIWDYAASIVQRAGGGMFRLFMRLASAPINNLYITPGVWDDSGNVPLTPFRKETAITSTSSRLVDLGTLQIPPGLGNATQQANCTLRLDVRSDTSTILNIDYIQTFPTTRFRHLVMLGNQIPNGGFVVDDAIEGLAYSLESAEKHGILSQLESPIEVWPDRAQRIYFLFDVDTGDAPVGLLHSARLYYRPRYLTV